MKVLLVAGAPEKDWPQFSEIDLFVGVDRGAWHLLEKNYRVDLAIGDFDSLTDDEIRQVFAKADKVITAPAEKDDTDTQLALANILSQYPDACIEIIGATGGRIDHFLANLWLVFEPRFQPYISQIVLKDRQNTIRFFLPGNYQIEKDPKMKYLAYCCLTPVKDLTLKESKYQLEKQMVHYPISYASNEFVTKKASFSFSEGIVAVIQSRD